MAGLFIVFAAGFMTGGYALEARRDVGAGLLPERPGAAEAAPSLRSPLALAWRLHRGLLLGWTIGLALTGAVMGGAAAGIGNLKSPNQQLTDILSRMGGSSGITDAFLAAIFGITGMVAAAYTVQATLRLRQQESSDLSTSRYEGRADRPARPSPMALRCATALYVIALLGATWRSRPGRTPMSSTERSDSTAHGPAGDDPTAEFVQQWRNAAYNCYSSGHKFCREVCPVMQVTRDEVHTPTAFHANVVAMEKGLLSIEDVARDYVHCTQCGACELRCPNTLFTGDFYRFRTRTVQLVKAMRALAVDSGIHQPHWQRWVEETDRQKSEPVLGAVPVSQENVRDWAAGLDIPIGGETILFCDCEGAFHRTSVPRAAARILQRAGVDFGLMREQWCCGGPAAEMGYTQRAREFAQHNVDDWRAVGATRIIVFDPHDYISFTEDYPGYFGDDYDFEIVLMVDLVAELIRDGRLTLTRPVERTVTYHDPCRLNKRKGIHEAPREILRAIPGLTFKDVDHVTQWSYCSGAGGGLSIERPDLTAEISRRRVERAGALGVDTLVSACVWSERPLSEQGGKRDEPVEVMDLFELVALACGLDAGNGSEVVA